MFDNTTAQPVITPKSYGKSIKAAELPSGIARFFPIASPSASLSADKPNLGLPAPTLLPILEALAADVHEIREAFAEIELRMVGGSLLIAYEAEWARAEAGVKWLEEHPDGESEEDEDEDESEEDDEDEEGKDKVGPPYAVKLIDFAHTRLKPGEGPDAGVLKGIDTVLSLLEGRIAEVKAALNGGCRTLHSDHD